MFGVCVARTFPQHQQPADKKPLKWQKHTHWFHLLFSEGAHGASRGQTTWKEGRKERRKEGGKEGRKGRKASTEYEKSGNFKAPKTEVISILKNARFTRVEAKS